MNEERGMRSITIPAHFDGNKIVLDEPFELEPDTQLIVTVLHETEAGEEREDWTDLAVAALESAYSSNEPEYTFDMVKRGQS